MFLCDYRYNQGIQSYFFKLALSLHHNHKFYGPIIRSAISYICRQKASGILEYMPDILQNPEAQTLSVDSQKLQYFNVWLVCICLEYINMIQISASVRKGRKQKAAHRFIRLILPAQGADSANHIFKYFL